MTQTVEVIEQPQRAAAMLHPTRTTILEHLGEADSAAGLARKLDLPRQRVNYHLRELLAQSLVELVEERQRGSASTRLYRRVGDSFTVSIGALGALGSRPENIADRFSSAYQIAVASRTIEELAQLRRAATAAKKKLPTMTLEVDVRFANAKARHAFSEELSQAIADLVTRYQDDKAPKGRCFRYYMGAYPKPTGQNS